MESIQELYRIGNGPSSSHTMGPRHAAELFLSRVPEADRYEVTLYGSLAATGKGHLTHQVLKEAFSGHRLHLHWKPHEFLPRHPNAMLFEALDANRGLIRQWTAYSIGGGKVLDDTSSLETARIYPYGNLEEIIETCRQNGKQFWEIVEQHEGVDIYHFLEKVWGAMQEAIRRGLKNEGVLPGDLGLPRKARATYVKTHSYAGTTKRRGLLFSYALAVAEENAAGGRIVTAPTCGSAGVLPGALFFLKKQHRFSDMEILRALATAGLIGTVVKANASISGAEVGCQGEIGVACAMTGGAACQLFGGTVAQIEYAAEMGIEHHLGLTCDPVAGLVQIPCIERNVFAAARAINHSAYALYSDGHHRISFDEVTEAMKQTGKDLSPRYKETSEGGLAVVETISQA